MSDGVRYKVITQEDPETGDLIIPIPIPVLKKMGWKDGDEVDVGVDEHGKLFLKKANK
jgi:bifunctional DNA-binding transcriptional regulator/antitoxin component of YhaV-PrlF toxin-antitoxin module